MIVNIMQLNEYQQRMVEIWDSNKSPDEELLFCAAGMVEESGEAMGKVKRWMRGEGFDREAYLKELGDCLAYLAIAVNSRGLQLSDVVDESFAIKRTDLFRATNEMIKFSSKLIDLISDELPRASALVLIEMTSLLAQITWNAQLVDSTLTEVMQLNLAKLADRKARLGTLRGSGDDR